MTDEAHKFQHVVHYIVWYFRRHLRGCGLGAVKLNKILWLMDVRQTCLTGVSMTGEEAYIKRKYGPVPPRILATLEQLQTDGYIGQTMPENSAQPYRISVNTCTVSLPEAGALSLEDMKIIRGVCRALSKYTGKQLSALSHDEVYDIYEEGQKIPLGAYLVAKGRMPGPESLAARNRLLAEIGVDGVGKKRRPAMTEGGGTRL